MPILRKLHLCSYLVTQEAVRRLSGGSLRQSVSRRPWNSFGSNRLMPLCSQMQKFHLFFNFSIAFRLYVSPSTVNYDTKYLPAEWMEPPAPPAHPRTIDASTCGAGCFRRFERNDSDTCKHNESRGTASGPPCPTTLSARASASST